MSPTAKRLIFFVLLIGLAPVVSRAATVSLTVNCLGQGNQSYASSGFLGIECSGHVQLAPCCSADPTVFALAFSSGPDASSVSVQVGASGGAGASADYTALLELTITDGNESGFGFYEPCASIGVGSFPPGAGDARLTFGSDVLAFSSGCGSPIPFAFGVSQTQQFSLEASGGSVYQGGSGATAEFSGFMVFDQSGQLLPTADVAVRDASLPEPGSLGPLGFVLALGWTLRRPKVRRIFDIAANHRRGAKWASFLTKTGEPPM